MATFSGSDGTRLVYHRVGSGVPLICLPGGPMQASAYLGDLGGLSAHRALIRLDLRGTGESAVPQDQTSYRCDRLVEDVEALRVHLGCERVDLFPHAELAVLPGGGHYAWLDDPAWLVGTLARFLSHRDLTDRPPTNPR